MTAHSVVIVCRAYALQSINGSFVATALLCCWLAIYNSAVSVIPSSRMFRVNVHLSFPRGGGLVVHVRDRKQAELELQNARRKETREMARDLESQLAAVDRIAQVGALSGTLVTGTRKSWLQCAAVLLTEFWHRCWRARTFPWSTRPLLRLLRRTTLACTERSACHPIWTDTIPLVHTALTVCVFHNEGARGRVEQAEG